MNTFDSLARIVIDKLTFNLECCGGYTLKICESEYSKDLYIYDQDNYMKLRLQINHIIPASMMLNQTQKIQIRVEGEECWTPLVSEYILKDQVGLGEKLLDSFDKYFNREVESTNKKLQLFKALCN